VTLLLNSSLIEELVGDLDTVFESLEAGFKQPLDGRGIAGQRVRTDLPAEGTATALLPGLLPSIPAYTVKVNAKFPEARPSLRGIVCLHSLEHGELLALLDSASLTAWRTGLAAALATDRLAPATAKHVGLIGAGAQGRLILKGLAHRRPVDRVTIHDSSRERAYILAGTAEGEFAPATVVVGECADAAANDIVVLATWSRTPLLGVDDVRPGQHLTSVGTDEPGKQELSAELLRRGTLIVDDRQLSQQIGAAANGRLPPGAIDATLTEVLLGQHVGRSNDEEVTVYAPVGLPWQDLALAWPLYRRALERGAGVRYDFLA
jgi:alanine dehydrogenase